MNGVEKIRPEHREKRAFVYARQSTMAQVLQHQTSTERQLELTQLAAKLGWSSSQIELIAEDLGRSGKFTENREGFQRLAAEVSLGHVGAIFSLDAASRLARSSADWHRLLEIAGLTRTLLVDEQTVYDPRDPNDRLLLGMKGTMADFELVWLRQRMDGGRWHRARRGEFRMRPPVGYIHEEDGSRLVLDPDEEIRRAVTLIFERYRVAVSCRDVVDYFAAHDLRFPARYGRRVIWKRLTLGRVHDVLHNPLYTGTYVYGRSRKDIIFVDGQRRHRLQALPMDQWAVVIRDAHPVYISWEQFMANQKRISENGPMRPAGPGRGAPREGRALLPGMLLCGRCGSRPTVRYAGHNGRSPSYACFRLIEGGLDAKCFQLCARNVDEPVVALVLETLTREHLEAATKVVELIEQEDAALDQQWKLRLERARYEARRAERQYDACDPDNRVVARTLETRWNEKLVELEKLEREHEEVRRKNRLELSDVDRRRIMDLAQDIPRLWHAPTTEDRDRKLLLRHLIQEVTVRPIDVPRPALRLRVLWHTQAVTELDVERLGPGSVRRKVRWRLVSTTARPLPGKQEMS